MVASLESLLDGVFDYAGIFPPARLDMSKAIEHYIRYIEGSDQWLVNRFVCPSARLPEIVKALDQRQSSPEIPITVIGTITTDLDDWELALEQDAKAMTAFMNSIGDAAALEAYEIRVPGHAHLESCLADLRAFSEVDVYVELPWGPEVDDSLALVAQTEWVGAKGRTGGAEASAYPTAESLASFLHSVLTLDVPFKFTAGLHHLLPIIDEETGGRAHGFLNILTAAVLGRAHDLSRKEMVDILRDDSLRNWTIDEEGIAWKSARATIPQIEEVRDIFVGIGSCSIDQPLADLQLLSGTNR